MYFVRYQSGCCIKGVLDACTISSAVKRSRYVLFQDLLIVSFVLFDS